jgi:hypothetical protein
MRKRTRESSMVKLEWVILLGIFSGLGVMARGVEARERSPERPKRQAQAAQQAAGYPASVLKPTLHEIAYGPHKRNVLDF